MFMTKLLILAYDFPPYISVGGLRPYSWYKYLHLFNVHPIVVTRQWENQYGNHLDYISPGHSDSVEIEDTAEGTMINTPYKPNLSNRIFLKYGEEKYRLFRKFISLTYVVLQYPLPMGNMLQIYAAADEYLKENKVDCIIATGDPFVLFKYASKLSERYDIPWIADYRDSWIQVKTIDNRLYKDWNAVFERKYLKSASKITTVSTFLQKQIEQNVRGKDFEIILNGYDPEIISETQEIRQNNDVLSIALNGTLQSWHPMESFLRVCDEIIKENSGFKLRLNFFGINKEDEIKEMLEQNFPHLKESAGFYPKMENLEYAREIATQNVFLLFNDYSILGTKIFDYLALKRKIVFCYEDDEEAAELKDKHFILGEIETESKTLQADLITATNSGIIVKNSEHLKQVLRELSDELRENGFIDCPSVNVEKYSRVRQVERLAEIVKEISSK